MNSLRRTPKAKKSKVDSTSTAISLSMMTREMSRVVVMTKDSSSDQVAFVTKTSKLKSAKSKEDTKEGPDLCSPRRTSSMSTTINKSASQAAMMQMDGLS